MKSIFVMALRLLIAFAGGLLMSFSINPLVNWPFGLPLLLALLMGIIGMQKVDKGSKRSLGGWLFGSCVAWFGMVLPFLLHPQTLLFTTSGCLVGCDGGPKAIYPDQSAPATLPIVFIGFLLGLLAIFLVVTIAIVIREIRSDIP